MQGGEEEGHIRYAGRLTEAGYALRLLLVCRPAKRWRKPYDASYFRAECQQGKLHNIGEQPACLNALAAAS